MRKTLQESLQEGWGVPKRMAGGSSLESHSVCCWAGTGEVPRSSTIRTVQEIPLPAWAGDGGSLPGQGPCPGPGGPGAHDGAFLVREPAGPRVIPSRITKEETTQLTPSEQEPCTCRTVHPSMMREALCLIADLAGFGDLETVRYSDTPET